jgi:hypothetical protein
MPTKTINTFHSEAISNLNFDGEQLYLLNLLLIIQKVLGFLNVFFGLSRFWTEAQNKESQN